MSCLVVLFLLNTAVLGCSCPQNRAKSQPENFRKEWAASVCVIVLQTMALHSISGFYDYSWGKQSNTMMLSQHKQRTHTQTSYFEGFLCRFTGADDDEARSSHTAETFQMKRFQHRHGRHGIILQNTIQSVEAKTEYDEIKNINKSINGTSFWQSLSRL